MRPLTAIAAVSAVALIGVGVAVGVRALQDDEERPVIPHDDAALDVDRAKPRFEGEIDGIYFAPPGAESEIAAFEKMCGKDAETVSVPWDRAGELAIEVVLPPEYDLQEDDLNTGAIACGDFVYAARWTYRVIQPDGWPAHMSIIRAAGGHVTHDAPEDRFSETEIGGREAILIRPVTESGRGSWSGVVFVEPFGITEITGSDLPLDQLLEVAAAVAKASQ